MSTDLKPRTRLDPDERREAILEVASEVFMEEGFAAASMSAIAARLGGSKGTLYNYFKSKEELFTAHVRRHCAWQQEEIQAAAHDPGLDIEEALLRLGRNLLRVILSDFGLRNFVLVVSEASRSPEIGRAFYEAGPATGIRMLVAPIQRAIDRGRLKPTDTTLAAYQFVGLCQNRMLKARLCNALPEPTTEEIEVEVAAAVSTFMAAFGAV